MLPNTFGIDASCDRYISVTSLSQLKQLLLDGTLAQTPLFILGGGSNVVLPDHYEGTILHLDTKGISVNDDVEDASHLFVTAQAGENWNDFVLTCCRNGWYGLENLAAIPGSVGAAPVQNVGAYGLEAKDVISSVKAYELSSGQERVFTPAECVFGYRTSVFKTSLANRYVVSEVTFRLSLQFIPDLSYKALSEAVQREKTQHDRPLDALALVDIITRLRWSKLPRPEELGSCCSRRCSSRSRRRGWRRRHR